MILAKNDQKKEKYWQKNLLDDNGEDDNGECDNDDEQRQQQRQYTV